MSIEEGCQPSAISLLEEALQHRLVNVEGNTKVIISFDFKLSIIPQNLIADG